jgi:hypothetical protein
MLGCCRVHISFFSNLSHFFFNLHLIKSHATHMCFVFDQITLETSRFMLYKGVRVVVCIYLFSNL